MTAKVIRLADTGPALPAKPKPAPAIIPEPLPWTDEKSFRAARRRWEHLVRRDKEMRPSERLVVIEIASYASAHSFAWPAAQTVSSDLGVSLRTVTRALEVACTRGWYQKMGRRGWGGSMQHRLSYDPQIVAELEVADDGRKQVRKFRRVRKKWGDD